MALPIFHDFAVVITSVIRNIFCIVACVGFCPGVPTNFFADLRLCVRVYFVFLIYTFSALRSVQRRNVFAHSAVVGTAIAETAVKVMRSFARRTDCVTCARDALFGTLVALLSTQVHCGRTRFAFAISCVIASDTVLVTWRATSVVETHSVVIDASETSEYILMTVDTVLIITGNTSFIHENCCGINTQSTS